ncbi:MAG: cytochrome c [Nitrospira sp.]|nr:cytochrome c [Nitrospira sp.]MCA9476943.1 cytochrome c [Nitrospira sp.]MCA9482093.1 cytochrome c [Nitrospira sp.]MCB9709616.1 cytochrome c [Nitrospiraceae bacterium]MDR4487021.1 cytochrome c [Nitrospirales bacterium]
MNKLAGLTNTSYRRGLAFFALAFVMTWSTWGAAQVAPGNPQNGKVLYEKHCLQCHGQNGDGQGPDMKFLKVQPANFHSLTSRSKTDEELMTIITFGAIFSPMHGWADRLTEDERWDVLRYIRLLAPFNPMAFQSPRLDRLEG